MRLVNLLALLAVVLLTGKQLPGLPTTTGCLSLLSQSDRYVEHRMFKEAEQALHRGLACQEKQVPMDALELADSYEKLAELMRWRGALKESEGYLRKALSIRSGVAGFDGNDLACTYNRLAQVLFAQRRYYEAEPAARKSKELAEVSSGPKSEGAAIALNTLGSLHAALEDLEGAERQFSMGLHIQRTAARRNANTATLLHNLATVRLDRGFAAEAEELYLESLQLQEELFGRNSPELMRTLEAYANALTQNGRKAQAREMKSRVRAFVPQGQ